MKRDEAMRARKILRSIPDPYREVFMWRVFAQLSYKQIGELFGKNRKLGVCHLSSGARHDKNRIGGERK